MPNIKSLNLENLRELNPATSFAELGFAYGKNAFSENCVNDIRLELDRVFENSKGNTMKLLKIKNFLSSDKLIETLFNTTVVSSLKKCMGQDLAYIGNFRVQRNAFGIQWKDGELGPNNKTGWHIDAGSERNNSYLLQPSYSFAKCGIYLQDSDNGWGGGIRLIPRSHLIFKNRSKWSNYLLRAINSLKMKYFSDLMSVEVPIKAGDFLCFDSRLWHSSLSPSSSNLRKIKYREGNYWELPEQHKKYVIYWDAGAKKDTSSFLKNSVKRSDEEINAKNESDLNFTEYLSCYFPDDYPSSFVDQAKLKTIDIASLSKEESNVFKDMILSLPK